MESASRRGLPSISWWQPSSIAMQAHPQLRVASCAGRQACTMSAREKGRMSLKPFSSTVFWVRGCRGGHFYAKHRQRKGTFGSHPFNHRATFQPSLGAVGQVFSPPASRGLDCDRVESKRSQAKQVHCLLAALPSNRPRVTYPPLQEPFTQLLRKCCVGPLSLEH